MLKMLKRLWRRLKYGKRISNAYPLSSLPCEWCKQIKLTTVNTIWSEADPKGRRVRMCEDCGAGCAA